MKVWCNLTPEQASLYQATVADMLARIEAAEPDIERRGLVLATMAKLKQVCNHPAHLLGDGSRLRRPVRQAGPAGGDLRRDHRRRRQGAVLHPVRRVRPDAAAVPGRPARLPGALPARRHAEEAARRDGRPSFQWRTEPAVFLLSLKAGGTGLNLTGGQPCDPRRPVVEPGGRGPGHRPGVPDRPAQGRPGAQVRLRRHAGGADRRDDRGEEGARRADRRHRRELADRAVGRRPARGDRAVAGGGVASERARYGRGRADGAGRRSRSRAASRRAASAARSASSGGRAGSSRCWSRSA